MSESTVFNDFYLPGTSEDFASASFTTERVVVPERAQLISVIVGIYSAAAPSDAGHDIDPLRQDSSTGMPTFEVPIGSDAGDHIELFATAPVTFLQNEHISAVVTGGDASAILYSFVFRMRRN